MFVLDPYYIESGFLELMLRHIGNQYIVVLLLDKHLLLYHILLGRLLLSFRIAELVIGMLL